MQSATDSIFQEALTTGLSSFFQGIDPATKESLKNGAEVRHIKAGEYLFHQGDPGSYLGVVLSGRLIAVLEQNDPEKILGEIRRTEVVGEMALLSDDPRSASVIAISDAYVAIISKDLFDTASEQDPQLLRNVTKQVIDRLKLANKGEQKMTGDAVIGLLDLVDDEGPSDAGLYQLVKQSVWFEPTLSAVNETKATNDLQSESSDIHINDYLMRQQEEDKSLLISLNGSDRWRERAIDLCDSLVFHVKEDQLAQYEHWISKLNISDLHWKYMTKFLVIQYDKGEQPEHVTPWLAHFRPSEVIRYQRGNPVHLNRVIRMITGNAHCITFAGGGAHGFAHLGVLRALNEAGIEIDVVGGASIGAIIAGLVALDLPIDEMNRQVKAQLSKDNPLNDYTLPLTAILKGKRMSNRLRDYFNLPIEHLWLNFFCVASDYIHCNEKVFDSGSLHHRIAASISIPGVLPPQVIDGVYYVDGGVLNNVPVNRMLEEYKGKRITVDLSNIKHFKVKDVAVPSPYKILFSRINPFKKTIKAPKMMGVIMKSITMSSYARKEEFQNNSHLYINPRVRQGFLAWKKFDPIVDEGYSAAQTSLNTETTALFHP
jgi:predicted acylesterase/phospholipase RssA